MNALSVATFSSPSGDADANGDAAVAIGLATAASPFASSSPDGLEKVATDKAFIEQGALHSVQEDSLVPDHAFPGVDDPRVATGLAGFTGTLLAFGAGFAIVVAARRRVPA